MKTTTLEQQFQNHEKSIDQRFKKEYVKTVIAVIFFMVVLLACACIILWKHALLWLFLLLIVVIPLLFLCERCRLIRGKSYREYERLERDYEQAQYCYSLEKNHTSGDMTYETLWSYSFSW